MIISIHFFSFFVSVGHLKRKILLERYFFYVFRFIVIFVLSILFFRFFIFTPGVVNGPSMEMTFIDDDVFYVNKFIYLLREPERFDVVQFIEPEQRKLVMKRVVGAPGEIISIRRGKVFVQKSLDEDPLEISEVYLKQSEYTKVPGQSGGQWYLVPSDTYFLLGDNRQESTDSRIYGPIHRSNIVGKVVERKRSE